MGQRRAGHVNRCINCKVNLRLCVCHYLKPIQIKSQVSLVVHVSELKLTSNTAYFAQKMLPLNSQLLIRGKVHDPFCAKQIIKNNYTNLFLYPHEDALELNQDFMMNHPGPYHFVIPDGNWQQARKVRQREDDFRNLPAVKLPSTIQTEYFLRKAPQMDWVCTYEAMAWALGVVESLEIQKTLMQFFRIWVSHTLKARSGDFS
jgi:DTW domain-containing protein